MDVRDFLRKLDLAQYESAFRDNLIDSRVLPKLTADDLKDLGVTIVGHRRLLLEAIAALREPTPSSAPANDQDPGTTLAPSTEASSTVEAERRPLSVMFCDLIGSTALSSRLDPEDLREIIRTYQACVAATIQQFDGFIARYVGDGVLIYFGWPEARETDAERAVRAGLAVAAAVSATPVGGEPLQVRIGIATGLVVIGEPIGSGDSRQQTAVGETPNLAARLQGLAGPGQVVIDSATRRQIGGLFECQDLGTVELKGLPAAVAAWQVVSENRTLGQFEALRSGTTPLVGRDEEVELLLRRWGQAKAGSGRVVLISAEPGVGKSRLAEALAKRIAGEPHVRLRYFCSPHHQDSALYPVIAQMERAAGFTHDNGLDAKLAKLQALLNAARTPVEDVALIAELHSLPSADLAPPLDLTPQRKKDKTFQALLRQVEGLARQQPLLMVFDDLHWIDPSSRELLDRLVERAASWPILLVAMFRPEFQQPWTGQPHVTMLTLARLDRRGTAAMVANLVGDAALPAEIVREIVERTDGVPLFVEELTKAVLESDMPAQAARSAMPNPGLSVPATLHASLLARLDRLGSVAKEVAQTGAAIGREFGRELLTTTIDLPEPQVHAALDRLANAGLLFTRGTPPQSTYVFKHALVRDTAYSTLLRERRQTLHAALAKALAARHEADEEASPELVGHHCQQAGMAAEAIRYYLTASRQFTARAALPEAAALLQRARHLIPQLPHTVARDRLALEVECELGSILIAVKGYAAPELGETFQRAHGLWLSIGRPAEFRSVPWGGFVFHTNRSEFEPAAVLADALLQFGHEHNDVGAVILGGVARGTTHMVRGEPLLAMPRLKDALQLCTPTVSEGLVRQAGLYPDLLASTFLATVQTWQGLPEQGSARCADAISRARKKAHAPTLASCLAVAGRLAIMLRFQELLEECTQGLIELARDYGYPFWSAQATIYDAVLRMWHGDNVGALELMCSGLADFRRSGASVWSCYFTALLSEAVKQQGQPREALRLLDGALAKIESTGEHWGLAELRRRRGDLLLSQTTRDVAGAEREFLQGLEVASHQSNRLWELRCATSLTELLLTQGRRTEARNRLGRTYAQFTEGFDAPDLKDAKALLDELS
jgi:class 3 adenylate cyclase